LIDFDSDPKASGARRTEVQVFRFTAAESPWLANRMPTLGAVICRAIVGHYGHDELLLIR